MFYKSPKLVDDLIIQRAVNPSGVSNPSELIARHAVDQAGARDDIQQRSRIISLNKARADEGQRQFDANMGISRDRLQTQRRNDATSTGLSAIGLGVSMANQSAARKRQDEIIKAKNQIISDLESDGGDAGMMWSQLLKLL